MGDWEAKWVDGKLCLLGPAQIADDCVFTVSCGEDSWDFPSNNIIKWSRIEDDTNWNVVDTEG